jgi:hypothetical protein
MAKEIFDQERPRSTMARRLDEAFAGCETWTLAPPAPRRSEMAFPPRRPSRSRPFDAASDLPESRAA